MPLPVPVFNIFDEFENLNTPNPLDTGGEWKLVSAPTDPVDICTEDGVTWTTQTLNAGDILYPGLHNPNIDFTGASCGGSASPDGTYVFEYGISTGDCPSYSAFTIEVIDGNVNLSLERTPEICWIELSTENPDTPSSKEAKISISPDRLCLNLDLRYTIKRKQFAGCIETITTLNDDLQSFGNLQITTTNLPKPLGDPAPLTQGAPFFLGVPGLFVQIQYRIELAGWVAGGYIETLRVGKQLGVPAYEDLNLSTVTLAGVSSAQKFTFADNLRTKIATELTALGASQTNAAFNVLYDDITDELLIWFLCANSPSAQWYGVDKTNWEVVYYPDAGGPVQVDNNTSSDFTYIDTKALNQFQLLNGYSVTDIDFYQNSYEEGLIVAPYFCTTTYTNIYNLTACNFNSLVLASGTKANIFDADFIACGS